MSLIKEILYGVLVEDWYYGLVLNVIIIFAMFVCVELAAEHVSQVGAVIVAVCELAILVFYIVKIYPYSAILSIGTVIIFLLIGFMIVEGSLRNKKSKKKSRDKPKSK